MFLFITTIKVYLWHHNSPKESMESLYSGSSLHLTEPPEAYK